ncbi:MAG: Asp-tRNA(Asn)/Glu-tRNA(Gln) amidotransferase subunit GatA [Candidatus Omnitrophota bacterium]|nr:Asp-tRNA(Asn)/Glu-tRNA(Gln) amidotransferase subunit GatA [Candidatus Omnitrophota bacterium]
MASESLASKTIHELRPMIQQDPAVAERLLEELLDRIAQLNGRLHTYLAEPDRERLRQQLREQLKAAPHGKLRGIPITVKDNICIKGEETACASRILQGFRPPYDATVIERLRREGAVLIPRANMDEFAFGSSTENSAFGPTLNPRAKADDLRVPGGSSGGSAAAVAADMAIAALGSDTGGSIRQPASFCGIVGLKPTYGRVSRYGLVAFASSLDQIGPLTKDARDAAILLSVIAGHDPRDSTSAPIPVGLYEEALEALPENLVIGTPDLPSKSLSPNVQARVQEAIDKLKTGLPPPRPVKLRHINHAIATYYIIATAEASSNLARYDGVQYGFRAANDGSLLDMYLDTRTQGFGAESKRRILLGTYVLSHGYYDAYYLKGMKVRTLIKQDFDLAFQQCDVVVMPTSPTVAFRPGEKLEDPLQMYLSDIYTISANLAGIPAVSVCCGTDDKGLPIGLQFLAPPFEEGRLLQVAHRLEQQLGWPRMREQLRHGDAIV